MDEEEIILKSDMFKLGFFPYFIIIVFGGDKQQMINECIKHEPNLKPSMFDEYVDRGSAALTTHSWEDSNIDVIHVREKYLYNKYLPAYFAHEAIHVMENLVRFIGADPLEEETRAYLVEHIVTQCIKAMHTYTND